MALIPDLVAGGSLVIDVTFPCCSVGVARRRGLTHLLGVQVDYVCASICEAPKEGGGDAMDARGGRGRTCGASDGDVREVCAAYRKVEGIGGGSRSVDAC